MYKKLIKLIWRVNWCKTIYFNFHYFPFSIALKLPVFVFRNTKLLSVNGNIIISGTIKPGLIRLGPYGVGTLDGSNERTVWQNNGTVIFNGTANIGSGSRLSINKGSVLTFGNKFTITGRSSVICSKEISFGNSCLLSWDILIMDTDFHSILDKDGKLLNPNKSIIIGNNVWIGCRNTILKGVIVADNVVIAAGSKITKSIDEPNVIVGGTDTQKILKTNVLWKDKKPINNV